MSDSDPSAPLEGTPATPIPPVSPHSGGTPIPASAPSTVARSDATERPAPTPTPPRSMPTPVGAARQWLRRIRKGGVETPSDPALDPNLPDVAPTSLLTRSPFQIGFFMAVGAMTAYGLVNMLVSLQSILVLALFALFVTLGLNPSVEWMRDRGVPRPVAVIMVGVGAIVFLLLAGWAVVPVATEQINRLMFNAPTLLKGLRENPQVAEFDAQFGVIDKAIEFLSSGSSLSALFGGILGAGKILANMVFSVIITLVLTIYFLATLPSIKEVIYQLAPASRRPRARYLANEMFARIGGYMSGMFIVITLWAVGSFIMLNLVGLGQYALALAVVTGLFSFIPVVGSSVGLVICTLVAFSNSVTAGFVILIYFVFYQQMDAYVVQPRVFSKSMNVPAVLVILGAISGGFLLGIPGALLAIPSVASMILLYREVLIPHLDRR